MNLPKRDIWALSLGRAPVSKSSCLYIIAPMRLPKMVRGNP